MNNLSVVLSCCDGERAEVPRMTLKFLTGRAWPTKLCRPAKCGGPYRLPELKIVSALSSSSSSIPPPKKVSSHRSPEFFAPFSTPLNFARREHSAQNGHSKNWRGHGKRENEGGGRAANFEKEKNTAKMPPIYEAHYFPPSSSSSPVLPN